MKNGEAFMKKYIFFTADIHAMGGMQNYVRSKAEYLQEQGWQVYIIFQGNKDLGCVFPQLDAYVRGGLKTLHIAPEKIYGSLFYWSIIDEMLEIIEYSKTENCQYLIESQAEYEAVWGEILAQIIDAKHICFICNERFRGKDKHYLDYMDFFYWKYQRRELAGIADNSLNMLFEGFVELKNSSDNKLVAAFRDNVCDYDSEIVEKILHKDWNIAYFGRCEKDYFSIIVDEIEKIALKYNSYDIQFVIIGNVGNEQKKAVKKLEKISNLTVSCIGCFAILPKKLFKKLDVVVAGSGCAVIAARQGVPTIVADAKTYQAIGIYGYTTSDFLYGENTYSYAELLEDVLIEKQYKRYHKTVSFLDKPEFEYEKFFDFIRKSKKEKKFFDFNFNNQSELQDFLQGIKYFLEKLKNNDAERKHFISWVEENYGKNIALFGIGKVGRLILDMIPELELANLYDNEVEIYSQRVILKPSVDNLNTINSILVTPIMQRKEMVAQLRSLGYRQKIIWIVDIINEYIYSKV